MALIRAQTFFAGVTGQADPRNRIGAKGIQVYGAGGMFWSKKSVIIRNAPYTIESPHLGQIETRLTFADIAKDAKGCRGFEDGLPCVAARIKSAMKGYRSADRMPEDMYPSRVKPSFHTVDELRAMLEKKAARVRAGMPARP